MRKLFKIIILCLLIAYLWGWRDAKRHSERVKNGDTSFDIRSFVK